MSGQTYGSGQQDSEEEANQNAEICGSHGGE
jgi:hypothetical protein